MTTLLKISYLLPETEIFFFNLFIFLAVLGLHCCARASHCSGFSYCGTRALGTRASVVVACGLSSFAARGL